MAEEASTAQDASEDTATRDFSFDAEQKEIVTIQSSDNAVYLVNKTRLAGLSTVFR